MKTKKLLVLASSLILLTACGGAPESSSSSTPTPSSSSSSSSSSSTRPSSSSTPAPSSSSSSTPAEPTRPATYAGFAYWAYEGSTRGEDFHEDVKWDKGATWTWTFTANKAVENAWLTIGAKMTNSSHADRTLFTNSNGASSSDAFESNPENDGTPRLNVNLNGEDKDLTNTKTYGDVLSTDEYRDLDLVHPVNIKEGKNVLKIGTNANVGYRLYLGEQVRFFYEGTGLELTLGAPAEESTDTTPVESSESAESSEPAESSDVATVSALELDTANVKKVYMVGDAFDPTGLGVKALLSDGSEVPLTSTDYSIAADFKTAGAEVDVTVSYGTVDASFKVKVGEYAATAVDIANVEGKAIVTISGTYGVLSAEEFKSFDWSTDFQVNGYKGGTWAGPWDEVANEDIEFTMGEGTWSFTRDVTEVPDEYYTGHFGHKLVLNKEGKLQKMDLKIKAEDASKNVKIGDTTYTIDYNVGHDEDPIYCWGNASLKVETENAPVWGVDSIKVVEDPVETGTAAIEFKVAFENYTEADFRALKWNVDFEGNGNYSNGWSGINAFAHDFGDKWAIKDGVATFYLNVDSLCLGGYTLHFGVGDLKDDKAPDFKPESFTASNMVVDGATYDLVCYPGSGDDGSKFWGCVGLVIGVDGEHNPTATFTNARVRLDDGIPHLGLFGIQNDAGRKVFYYDTQVNGGSWKTTIRESTVYITGDNWTIDSDISGIENGTYIIHWHCGNKSNDMPNFPDESLSSVSYQGRVFSLKHVAAGWDAGVTITALVIEKASN